jgi:hypothetical protein
MSESTPGPAPAPKSEVSMNDTLPNGNPSGRTVLIVLGLVAIGSLILTFRTSLGF